MKQLIKEKFLEIRKTQSNIQELQSKLYGQEEDLTRTLVEEKACQFLKPIYSRIAKGI